MLDVVDPQRPIAEQAKTMAAACETTGFFLVPVSAIDQTVADEAWDAATRFFAQPDSDKLDVAFPEPGYPYGYSPFRHESLAASLGDEVAAPDLKESFSVGPDCGTHDVDGNRWVNSPSVWPSSANGLKTTWTAYYRLLTSLGNHLAVVMAHAFDLPSHHFLSKMDRPITSMRALHYPEFAGEPGDSLRAGAHSDYGMFTILRTDDAPGLQIENPDGSWADVEPNPDMFIVNPGDSIAQWTNDRWRSTVHRVVTSDPRPRQSFAFFQMANWDARIECLPSCLNEGEAPRHEPVEAGPWLMQKFQSTV